jgi:hypothetical protein
VEHIAEKVLPSLSASPFLEAVDFLAGCLKMTEKRSGFFTRGSHARENDKLRECVAFFCHSCACLAREESRFFARSHMKIDNL